MRRERQLKKVALLLLLTIFIASLSPSHANEVEPCGWIDRSNYDKNINQAYGHEVAGESYYAGNAFSLLKKKGKKVFYNVEFDVHGQDMSSLYKTGSGESVGLVAYFTAKLVPEPSNKFDKFAIKVVIQNKHVGYVPKSFSFETAKFIKDSGQKSLGVKACIIYTNGREVIQYNSGPQVYLHFQKVLFPEVRFWYGNRAIINRNEKGPGAKCTAYFSKWICGLDG